MGKHTVVYSLATTNCGNYCGPIPPHSTVASMDTHMTKQQAIDLDPETFSLEFLMSAPPEELSNRDLDQIVQYHRNVRADRAAAASAPKGQRKKPTTPAAAIPTGLKKLISAKAPKIDRRGF